MPTVRMRQWTLVSAGLMMSAAAACAVWGVAVGPRRLRVEEHDAHIPYLPGCWDGELIALVSDVQVGMTLGNEAVVADAIARIVQRRPAAVLLAGDFILHTGGRASDRIQTMRALLEPLGRAGLPVFAVLGNHDYQLPDDAPRLPPLDMQVANTLRAIGVNVLRNEAVPIAPRGTGTAPLFIVGLGEYRMQDDRPHEAFASVPDDAPRVVLMHNPQSFPRLASGSAPLAVAGHTHGAQVTFLPRVARPWWMRLARMPRDLQHGSGWMDSRFGRVGNRLYISRGIGFSTAPVRINATPELTFFTLRRAAAPDPGSPDVR